ncbi:MAG: lecithin retinol acyltransferase family protein [Treponema sp.]|jgi:ribosomal protein L24|nr:lecithin retinol acyltransferase family protein [Treponema sp.]
MKTDCPLDEINVQGGDILYVHRGLYKHYGVYAGNGKVIHFAPLVGKEISAENAVVHETNLGNFLKGGALAIDKKSKAKFSQSEIVERARSQIGSKSYNLVFFNCEHFARWCTTGVYESDQVNAAIDVVVEGVNLVSDLVSGNENPESGKKLITKLIDYLD